MMENNKRLDFSELSKNIDITAHGGKEFIENFKEALKESVIGEKVQFNTEDALQKVQSGEISGAEFMEALLAEENKKVVQKIQATNKKGKVIKMRSPMSNQISKKKKRK